MIISPQFKKNILKAVLKYGTPSYIYSKDILEDNIYKYKKSFRDVNVLFCYALKANSNRVLLKIISKNGFGADVVSIGEMLSALSSGFDKKKIIFSGVGKTYEELSVAADKEILFINVESFEELKVLSKISVLKNKNIGFSIRINPNVDPHTHKYISTGKYGSKFGVSAKEAFEMYKWAKKNKFLVPIAVHFHLGSQIFKYEAYLQAFLKVEQLIKKLKCLGINIRIIDLGGGWGVKEGEVMTPPDKLAAFLSTKKENYSFIMEPGRSIVSSCGFFVVKTLYRKKSGVRQIVITDGGMNDFVRPSLYGARHPVINLNGSNSIVNNFIDIYGPVCESGDFLAKNVNMKVPDRGNLLCFLSAGAYGYSMSSNYNLRRKPAEILVSGKDIKLIRKRQNYEDFLEN
ncbi:MAG: diaminopimelate decarboxylase [Elusimicrobia bacterium]|nr:diaminopimelate decarboxylase [Elusimicrobiota bacterium]